MEFIDPAAILRVLFVLERLLWGDQKDFKGQILLRSGFWLKRGAAPAAPGRVWVIHTKSGIVQAIRVVNFTVLQEAQAFTVNDQSHTVFTEDMVLGLRPVNSHGVLPAGAAALFHPDPQTRVSLGLLLSQKTKQLGGGLGGEADHTGLRQAIGWKALRGR